MATKILNITPAPAGWTAAFNLDEKPGGKLILHPIACFALVEVTEPGATFESVYSVTGDVGSGLDFAEEVGNYAGTLSPHTSERLVASGRAAMVDWTETE